MDLVSPSTFLFLEDDMWNTCFDSRIILTVRLLLRSLQSFYISLKPWRSSEYTNSIGWVVSRDVIYNACNWSVFFLDRWSSAVKAGKTAPDKIEALHQKYSNSQFSIDVWVRMLRRKSAIGAQMCLCLPQKPQIGCSPTGLKLVYIRLGPYIQSLMSKVISIYFRWQQVKAEGLSSLLPLLWICRSIWITVCVWLCVCYLSWCCWTEIACSAEQSALGSLPWELRLSFGTCVFVWEQTWYGCFVPETLCQIME